MLLATAALTLAACGGGGDGAALPPDPDAPVIQVRSEGGFTTPEMNLGRGPSYTLLGDGRLIYEGPVIAIYPGPLLPNYQMTQLTEDLVDGLLTRDVSFAGERSRELLGSGEGTASFEIEFSANPARNWRVLLNASKTDARRTNIGNENMRGFMNLVAESLVDPDGLRRLHHYWGTQDVVTAANGTSMNPAWAIDE